MKVFMIGGTGLLGLEGAKELVKQGHKVVSLALPPLQDDLNLPDGMEVKFGNYLQMSDAELKNIMKDCDGFVFAAGVDERVEAKPPIYDLFKKYNIDALTRLLDIAKAVGIKHTVVLGSYFSYFAKEWKDLELTKHHPYIRSRIDQENAAFAYADDGVMDVAVLELPYIFGAQKGRKPVWLFIAEMIKNTPTKELYYPTGGTTMVTIRQVGEAIAGALENNKGAKAYPVGWYNMTWKQWLEEFSADMNDPKTVVTIPTEPYLENMKQMKAQMDKENKELGLDMVEYVKLMTTNTFIDKKIIEDQLGVKEDDIHKAIQDSVDVCMDIMKHPDKEVLDMKAE
ncbi:dihydroflavonol-4-reductase [Breznakia sp. PF5-3]|uniref:NAD-dependent epimerase/dehydratase family protein n=1 Tax=unclassified Breznakia TaxID=2623764 RepID=UPI002404B71D|nr:MULTISPECIES: NAD(P)-dependent oxidoreductase [unclassified Breznakia]MDF9825054.1 dihydroflavonol-4-reductase [Breznakia sp. PM6-1]MDF9835901.1 dihydroflavonol-4-reductase [Breznakia sp. PF5-3]MDF9837362.1 dihydroflavonol-4-reductase [Breznakia sp. PFB2-8]MDF9859297.1 dihydroflavonol-4-reductase [Breznakia sp. PH5-24]